MPNIRMTMTAIAKAMAIARAAATAPTTDSRRRSFFSGGCDLADLPDVLNFLLPVDSRARTVYREKVSNVRVFGNPEIHRKKRGNSGNGKHKARARRALLQRPGPMSERIVTRLGLQRDPAQFGKSVDAGTSTKATPTRILHAPERHLRFVVNGRSVDMADA